MRGRLVWIVGGIALVAAALARALRPRAAPPPLPPGPDPRAAELKRKLAESREILSEREGVAWVVDEVAAVVAEHSPDAVVVDMVGQSRSLVAPLEKAGIELKTTDTAALVAACAGFSDAVHERRLVHRGDPVLTAAVLGAKQRAVGDAWAWARRSSRSNIAPLVACTLAAWGTTQDSHPIYWAL